MFLSKSRVRSFLLLNAVCALSLAVGIGCFRLYRRSREYQTKAELYATLINIQSRIVIKCRDPEYRSGALYFFDGALGSHVTAEEAEVQLKYYQSLREKYARAARHAWENVPPDPPDPELQSPD